MNWQKWLDKGDIQKVTVTEKSLNGLKNLIERDLKDSQVIGLSLDRRFATAYSAALALSSYAIRKEGYRVSGKIGHHQITFDLAEEILGSKAADFTEYFNRCRRKRNQVDYDFTNVVTEDEVDELIKETEEFKKIVLG